MRKARVLLFPAHRSPDRHGADAASGCDSVRRMFQDMKILVVEDDFIVAFDMQSMLEEEGAQVLGPAATVQEARDIIATEAPQAAVLDVNLSGEFVFPLAQELLDKGIPFLFATAYADNDQLFPAATKNVPRLSKPVLPAVLVTQLQKLLR